ncbi:interleukin-6 receptor subunit beta [Brienomyrus brachyistius]|uniref:interleukin-6 receptor subunit beta n=1 Tax=Brienomyrus brachyistius TaxID=42636 RepID=UPI0020B257B3|nr:interleukin-6 receptor subunit beta [Brienomyrus brachyistius]XP_048875269.1 interleukin-6 receptor subunit beta [Brienomyrus brachyistius]XP_048875270.1 interleukin-6 receptor subunit beta [Brienomyrus brachyistius]XP_048875272.1 interleukin-6 receptor subunit beta [Brienomyrus brachyistius]
MVIPSRMDLHYAVLLLVSVICAACCHACSPDICLGIIVPESPVLEIGKEFTATCVLYEFGHRQTQATADDIYWQFGNVTVDKEYYTKINNSAVSLTVTVTKDLKQPLKCNIYTRVLSYKHPKNVHGIFFRVGYPPKKPENLSCILSQDVNKSLSVMNCTWDPGAASYLLKTTYELCYTRLQETHCATADKREGIVHFNTTPFFFTISIWVRVQNELRIVDSDKLQLDVKEIIKPSPPENIRLTPEKNLPNTMMVQWKSPLYRIIPVMTLHYIIRYCVNGSSSWNEVPSSEIAENANSFRLQSLMPFTDYVVQMYCKESENNRYWSEWSGNVTAKTPEATPLDEPGLWKVLTPSEGDASGLVKLLWREPSQSNGVILGYNVTIEKADGKQETFETLGHEYLLPKDAIRVNMTAYNSVGVSPKATLTVNKEYDQPVESVDCVPVDGKLMVKWKIHKNFRRRPSRFVIEWVSKSDGKGDWQQEPREARNTTLKGDIQPFKRYNVSVYPIYDSFPGTPRTIQAYLEQKAPSHGPVIKVKSTGKHEVQLEWPEIPLDHQNGFITGYTIFYKELNDDGIEKSVSLGPEIHSYELGSLKKNSKYVLCIMASTAVGSTNGSDFTFGTSLYGRGEVEAIVVSVCIGFLFLTVIVVAICINKHTVIKKRIWPQVPDPSNSTIANWTPDFPTKPDTPKEGSMTDVSVVEVDVFDKPVAEEDKASLHLKKDKYMSDEHSSGIGGSSCMSSPRQSVSDCDEGDSGQTTASTVQYSSVVVSGYKGQTPSAPLPAFARSESTQPLLESEERPDDPPVQDACGHLLGHRRSSNLYFRRPWAVEEDSPTETMEGDALDFCSMEDTSQSNRPVTENLLPNETMIPTRSYMAQVSGYRPQ